jgi:hypothetical protein
MGLLSLLLFLAVVLGQTFRAGPVTFHRIQGAVASYLLLGVIWAHAYALVAQLRPGAFSGPISAADGPRAFLYFSFVTLATVGYGDVLPVHPVARSLAMLEAVTGTLYLATVIARLVSLTVAPGEGERRQTSARRSVVARDAPARGPVDGYRLQASCGCASFHPWPGWDRPQHAHRHAVELGRQRPWTRPSSRMITMAAGPHPRCPPHADRHDGGVGHQARDVALLHGRGVFELVFGQPVLTRGLGEGAAGVAHEADRRAEGRADLGEHLTDRVADGGGAAARVEKRHRLMAGVVAQDQRSGITARAERVGADDHLVRVGDGELLALVAALLVLDVDRGVH